MKKEEPFLLCSPIFVFFFWLHERKKKKQKKNNYVLIKDTSVASASKAKDKHDNG